MKVFIRAANEQFRLLNVKLDGLQSFSNPKSNRRLMFEEEEEADSDLEKFSSNRSKRVGSKGDNNLGSIKMKIPTFQGKNNPELYLE